LIEQYPSSSLQQIERLRHVYSGRSVLVTGGASFIGSHLVDALLALGALVTVVDDFSSGSEENLPLGHGALSIAKVDLSDSAPLDLFNGIETVFHLAAIHGGRGFIETSPARMLENLKIDHNVFSAAKDSGVKKIVFASSACAYPTGLQKKSPQRNFLSESHSGQMGDQPLPDGLYGWTKLIGEYQLEQIFARSSVVARSARIFTAFGERENESHAAIALIAKGVLRLDPFPVWGDGNQTRNFTYVTDTVAGLISLGSDNDPGFEICNVGTDEHVTVREFISEVFEQLDWLPEKIDYQLDKPVGVASRSSDNSKIFARYEWKPKVSLSEGVKRTLDWYVSKDDKPKTVDELEQKLMAR